jgi:4-amino-4-deoxy-L-arabinose transferase-like glycosyltransferase
VVFGDAGEPLPTAFHLPLFPVVLAGGSLLGATSSEVHQAIGCAFGAGTVVALGYVGRRLGGDLCGIAAAGIASVYGPLVVNDSLMMSESLYGLLLALVLLASLRYLDEPAAGPAVLLGLAIAGAALTRSEALAFVPLLAPLWLVRPRRLGHAGLTCLVVIVCVAPWAIRNSLTFDEPVLLTTGDGSVLAGANLPSTYRGDLLGAWDFKGLYETETGRRRIRNEAVQSRLWRTEAVDYAGDNLDRLPLVMAVRVMRTWSVYPLTPAAKANFAAVNNHHIRSLEYFVLACFVLVLVLAAAGVHALRGQRLRLWVLLAPAVLVTVVSALGYGDPRFRQAADVALVALAAAGASSAIARRRPPAERAPRP